MYSSYRGGLRIPRMLNALFTFSTDRNSRGTEKNKNESIASVRLLLPRTPNVKSRMLDIIRRDGDKLIIFDGDLEMRAIWCASQKSVLRYSTLENAVTFITGGLIPFVGRFQSSSKNNYSQAVSSTVGYKVSMGPKRPTSSHYKVISVDASKLVRHSFDNTRLERRVVHNKGGKSRRVIFSLFQAMPVWSYTQHVDKRRPEVIKACLELDGPALVSHFKTDEFFLEKRRCNTPLHENDTDCFIHQFDGLGEHDIFKFFSLGTPTPEELAIVENIENANANANVVSVSCRRRGQQPWHRQHFDVFRYGYDSKLQ